MPTARAICARRAIDSSTSLLATIIRSASSSITTTMKGSGFGGSPFSRRALLGDRLLDVAVVLLDVAHALGRQRLVALFHLAHRPAQRVRRLLRIDDDRRQQVRDVLVHPELEPLRVDHDQPHIVGRRAVEDAREHRVDADRLAGAGRAGDQQVRHRREVGDVRLAVDRLAERQRQLRRSSAGRRPTRAARAARSARGCGSGIWMPTVDLPGMRSISTDSACIARHRSSARPVILRVLHAGVRLELEGRDDRARVNLHDACLRPRTRGTSPRAAARRPSARARRSCARSSARRAARAAAACSRPCGARPAPSCVGSGSGSGSGGAGTVTFGGLGGANDSRAAEAGGCGAAAASSSSASRDRLAALRRSASLGGRAIGGVAACRRRGAPFFVCLAITSRRCCSRRRSSRQLAERRRGRATRRPRDASNERARTAGRTRTAST